MLLYVHSKVLISQKFRQATLCAFPFGRSFSLRWPHSQTFNYLKSWPGSVTPTLPILRLYFNHEFAQRQSLTEYGHHPQRRPDRNLTKKAFLCMVGYLFIRLAEKHGPYHRGLLKNTGINKCSYTARRKVLGYTHRQYWRWKHWNNAAATIAFGHDRGRRKGPPRFLKFQQKFQQRGGCLSFEWEKQISPLLAP